MAGQYGGSPYDELPFALQLARFLLGASHQIGEFQQDRRRNKLADNELLETEGRIDLGKARLTEQTRATQAAEEDRDLGRQDRLAAQQEAAALKRDKAARAAAEAQDTQAWWQTVGKGQDPFAAAEGRQLPQHIQEKLVADLLAGRKPKAPRRATLSPGQRMVDEDTGATIAEMPAVAKDPPAPSAERDYHAIATEELGPGASPAQVAKRVRELDRIDREKVAQQQGAITLGNQRTLANERDDLERKQKSDAVTADLQQVDAIINKMAEISPRVNRPGVAGRLQGLTINKGKEFIQSDVDINQMSTLSQAYASLIAKGTLRQSGVLSDQDLRRVETALPQVGDNAENAKQKLDTLRSLTRLARVNQQRIREGLPPISSDDSPAAQGSAPPGFQPRVR